MKRVKLYSYWRSTAAYRVRIALNIKGVPYDYIPVHLIKDGGQQHADDYVALNPSHMVPTVVLDDGTVLTQSLAIMDYLEQTIAENPLLPTAPNDRAQVMAAAHILAVDTHPVNNLRVVQHLDSAFGASQQDTVNWMLNWTGKGLTAFNQMVRPDTPYAFCEQPTLADICLVAQLYNARRWKQDLTDLVRLVEIEQNCLKLKAFADAQPHLQPDAEPQK
ncbi:MAG: maleylacetoacetate isomerase [Paracoccaceae bacterium]